MEEIIQFDLVLGGKSTATFGRALRNAFSAALAVALQTERSRLRLGDATDLEGNAGGANRGGNQSRMLQSQSSDKRLQVEVNAKFYRGEVGGATQLESTVKNPSFSTKLAVQLQNRGISIHTEDVSVQVRQIVQSISSNY